MRESWFVSQNFAFVEKFLLLMLLRRVDNKGTLVDDPLSFGYVWGHGIDLIFIINN